MGTRDAFLQERLTGVGGSDSAVVLGLSPWKTPLELWAEKLGRIPPEDLSDSDPVHFGHVLEDVVAQEYVRRRSKEVGREIKVRRVNTMLRHKEYPWMIAHLDRDVLNEPRILECKTADKWTSHKWGESGSDLVPDPYIVQCQHYLAVTGADVCDLAVLIGGNDFRIYTIEADREWHRIIIERTYDFWQYVQSQLEPPLDFADKRALEVVRRLYPGTNGAEIPALERDVELRAELEFADQKAKGYAAVAEAAKSELLYRMGPAAVLRFSDGASLTRAERKRRAYAVAECAYVDARMKKPGKDD